jgi:hypothetical protein
MAFSKDDFFKDPRVKDSPRINWPGGKPSDKPEIQEPRILSLLAEYNFTVRTGNNCYEIVNAVGDVIELPFGDDGWEEACEQLGKVGG